MTTERQFPVLWQGDQKYIAELKRLECPRSVPWDFIADHADWCDNNHGQTPERLAQRGGLAPAEMVAVVERLRLPAILGMRGDEEVRRLKALLAAYVPKERT